MMRSRLLLVVALVLCAVPSLIPSAARASGFFLTERGVRSLGRGGAFVAGAEGAESLWINPAGLAGAGVSFRLEGNQTFMRASFTRVDDEGVTRPTVELDTPFLPIPMFAITHDLGLRNWDFGIGVYAPSAAPYTWPDNINGTPAPQRYSLYSMKGSIFANLALGIAWHGIRGLSIGVAPTLIAGRFTASTVLSACDGFVCSADTPEDPEFDATTRVTLPFFATLMVGIGVTYETGPVKIGASFSTPWNISGKSEIDVKLPSNPIFSDAIVDGKEVDVDIPFPWMARFGIEFNPSDELSLEVSGVYEAWSRQDYITIDPHNITMRNVIGIGDYEVGQIKIQRLFSDSYSVRAGLEYLFDDLDITVRMGLSYDSSAIKDNALSPITLDSNKVVAGLGATLHLGSVLEVDFVYGHVFLMDRDITDSDIVQPAAIRPMPLTQSHIAKGNYTMEADFVGLGSTTHF